MAPNTNNRNIKQRFADRFGRSSTTPTTTTTTAHSELNNSSNMNNSPTRPNRSAAPSAGGVTLSTTNPASPASASGASPSIRHGLIVRSKSTSPAENSGSLLLSRSALHLRDDDASSVMVESMAHQHFPAAHSKRGTVRSVRSSLRSSMKKVSGSISKDSKSSGHLLKSHSSLNPIFDGPETYPEDVYLARKSERRSGVRSALKKFVSTPTFSSKNSSKHSSSRLSRKQLSKSEQNLEENRLNRASTNPKFEAPAVTIEQKESTVNKKSTSSAAKAIFLSSKVKLPSGSKNKNTKNVENKTNKNKNKNEQTVSPIAQPAVQHVIKSTPPSTPTDFIQQEPIAVDSAGDSEVRQRFKDTYRLAKHAGPAYNGGANTGGPGNRRMKFYVGEQLVEQCRA